MEHTCAIKGYNLTVEDPNGYIAKAIDKIANGDNIAAITIASYIKSKEFLNYIKNIDSTIQDLNDILDYETLVSNLKDYYYNKHRSVSFTTMTESRNQIENYTSTTARSLAYEHVANIIRDIHYQYIKDNPNTKVDRKEVLKNVQSTIQKKWFTIRDNVLKSIKDSDDYKEYDAERKLYDEELEELKKLKTKINDVNEELKELKTKINNGNETLKEEFDNKSKSVLSLMKDFKTKYGNVSLSMKNLINLANNIIQKHGTIQDINYSNLYIRLQTNSTAIFEKAFEQSILTNIIRDYKSAIDSYAREEVLDDSESIDDYEDSKDETSKTWTDNDKASIFDGISNDVKIYLDGFYYVETKPENDSIQLVEDTANELGVSRRIGARTIITELVSNADFSSIEAFINSIDTISKSRKEMYGLANLYRDIKSNRVLANKLYNALNIPVLDKVIIDSSDSELKIDKSNKTSDRLSSAIYDVTNSIRGSIRSIYKTIINKKYDNLKTNLDIKLNSYYKAIKDNNKIKETKEKLIPILTAYIQIYYPNITTDNVETMVNDVDNIKKTINSLIITINKLESKIKETHSEYIEAVKNGNFDNLNAKYDSLYLESVNVAKAIYKYIDVKTALNSINAEGKLTNDTTYNSYLSTLFRIIAYGTEENSNAGLQILLNNISKGEQYKHEPLFWGVEGTDRKGLFIRNGEKTSVNPDAKEILQKYLFNGARNEENNTSAMYGDKLSKLDYLISSLIAFNHSIKAGYHISSNKEKLSNYAGYFMRTPSDAPKNSIIQAPRYKSRGIMYINNEIYNKVKAIRDRIKKDTYIPKTAKEYSKIKELSKLQEVSYEEFYNIITDGIDANKTAINSNKTYSIKIDNVILVFTGTLDSTTHKIKLNEIENILNANIKNVLGDNGEYYLKYEPFDINQKKNVIENILSNIENTKADKTRGYEINKDIEIFKVLKQHLYGEINTLIDQLNNVFKLDETTGEYVLVDNTRHLIDKYHIKNGKLIDENTGKLTGNIFSFHKLFNVGDFKAGEAIEDMLSLYGETNSESIIIKDGKSVKLNTENPIITIEDGRIKLNEEKLNSEAIDNIIKKWIIEYYFNVVDNIYNQVANVSDEFTKENIFNYLLNYAVTYMSFDSIFEGNSAFYKSAQDFLKRAKEVQAGGMAYAGYDIGEELNDKIKTKENESIVIDNENKITLEDLANVYVNPLRNKKTNTSLPVEGTGTVRNSFKAITIATTTRVNRTLVVNMRTELMSIIKSRFEKENPTWDNEQVNKAASTIITKITKGYEEATKTNDAQSYITLEEFVRRKYYDGTLNEYLPILKQIYEYRKAKKEGKEVGHLSIEEINAKIQVQKNFYYDQYYDEEINTHRPRQIKNAEFVIIPELVEGTDLEKLYNYMNKYGIDQVNTTETSKASTKYIFTFWDNHGVVNKNFENDLIKDSKYGIETYYYQYLTEQQQIKDHMIDKYNKAGLQILRKIIDNAPIELEGEVRKFFNAYVANIQEDYTNLLFEMGWKVDENGNIVNIDGSENLNFSKFLEKVKIEAQRLGLDENFVDYITLDENNVPVMPNVMSISVSKMQSVFQSIFNKRIVRQTLPGWHGVQVSAIGAGQQVYDANGDRRSLKYHPAVYANKDDDKITINEDEYKSLSKEEQEKYELKYEAYAEALVPRWSNLIPKDYPIEKLAKEGLDVQIGYRIPTEGKQSVSIIKVVGYLDDVYGSTIILPEEWVTQTGSDYDVDTVYAITYNMGKRTDKNGDIVLYKKSHKNYKDVKFLYRLYVQNKLLTRLKDYNGDKLTDKDNKYSKLEELRQQLYDAVTNKDTNPDDQYRILNEIAKELQILNFDEWNTQSDIAKYPREVRENEMLDAIVSILENSLSREENFSRSNYDDLGNAMSEMDKYRGETAKSRSTYNISDQIDFMENATNGMSLKAISVSRDTFGSLCNRCGVSVTTGITVEYDCSKNGEYDADLILAAYPDAKYNNTTGIVKVTHKQICNSKNNRNVVGQLITPYTSQTTAHILDAIKEGAVYNETLYTFGVFKTLVDLGIDYKTAIAFIEQPAITRINEINNKYNSVYVSDKGNIRIEAIKEAIVNLGIKGFDSESIKYMSLDTLSYKLSQNDEFMNKFMDKSKPFFEKAGVNGPIKLDSITLSLNVNDLIERLKSASNGISNAEFDFLITCLFFKYKSIASGIEQMVSVCNPDKYGAAKTIFETRNKLDKIENIRRNGDNSYGLYVFRNGVSIPLIDVLFNYNKSTKQYDIVNSPYSYITAMLQYGTLSSVLINSQFFDTETKQSYQSVRNAENKLGRDFTEEEYVEYIKYITSAMYYSIPLLVNPVYVESNGVFAVSYDKYDNDAQSWKKEVLRVYGLLQEHDGVLEVRNMINPTNEELEIFMKFTPAQKIEWLQKNLENDSGIFGLIKTNKVNQYKLKKKGYSEQRISFIDGVYNINDLYVMYNEAFYNNNPFIRLAALDILKYAFLVDGYKFKKDSVAKLITNKVLKDTIDSYGTNIKSEVLNIKQQMFNDVTDTLHVNKLREDIDEKFIRSHSELVSKIYINKDDVTELAKRLYKIKRKYNEQADYDENTKMIVFNTSEHDDFYNSVLKSKLTGKSYVSIVTRNGKNQNSTLYKIITKEYKTERANEPNVFDSRTKMYLVPLNPLDKNEYNDNSFNSKNNKYPTIDYYYSIIENMDNVDSIITPFTLSTVKDIKEVTKPNVKASITTDITDDTFDVRDTNVEFDDVTNTVVNTIEHASKNGDKRATQLASKLARKNISSFDTSGMYTNRKFIYDNFKNYITDSANIMYDVIHHYRIGDKDYDIGDRSFYEVLRNHKEEVPNVIKLLLDSITFGNTLGNLMTLSIEVINDDIINSAVESIRNSIMKIRNDSSIKAAFNYMFNYYLANEYTLNPNIRIGLSELKDTFGDAGWWETWIGSPNAVSNKEIQTVFNLVNSIIAEAIIDEAPNAKQKFLDRYDAIMKESGTLDMDKIVNSKLQIIPRYNDNFTRDKDAFVKRIKDIRDKYGIDSIEYHTVKLKFDEWLTKNVHRKVIADYYSDKNAATRKVLSEAGDDYVKYKKLQREYYADDRPYSTLTKEEQDARDTIKNKMAKLRYSNASIKEYETVIRNLNNKYFNYKANSIFKETLDRNLKIISNYDKTHVGQNISEKLENDEYRNAYTWIKENAYYKLNDEANEAIQNAFNAIRNGNSNIGNKLNNILRKLGAIDEYGDIDPRKLTRNEIRAIKKFIDFNTNTQLEEKSFDYINVRNKQTNEIETIPIEEYDKNIHEIESLDDVSRPVEGRYMPRLIKAVKPEHVDFGNEDLYEYLNGLDGVEYNPKRAKIIEEINSILSKIAYSETGINFDTILSLSDEDIIKLGELYEQLRNKNNKIKRSDEYIQKLAEVFDSHTEDEILNKYNAYRTTDSINRPTKVLNALRNIFYTKSYDGTLVPNTNLLGYFTIKEEYKDKYEDKAKKEAIQLIKDNVEFIPTEYYYEARNKAIENGIYKEWFADNHVFNEYTGKFEPLRIWTTIKVKEDGSLKGQYEYVPTFENREKEVKEEYANKEYKHVGKNYNSTTGEYNTNINLTEKEKHMKELLEDSLDFFKMYNKNSVFLEQGYIPRKYEVETDWKWYGKQALGVVGLEWRDRSNDRSDFEFDYDHDRFIPNTMLQFLKGKGYKKEEEIRVRGYNESAENYSKYLNEVRERNKKIREENLAIDNAHASRDIRTVFSEAIHEQVLANAKTKAKNWLYLLQEEIKQNPAYRISKLTGKPIQDKKHSTDSNTKLVTTEQTNSLSVVRDYIRRVIYDQFRDDSKMNKFADIAKNITSSKYMILNLTSAIANVGTGFVNIVGEAFANDNFNKQELLAGVNMYRASSVKMIRDAYKDNSDDFAVALTKYFNVVDIDAMNERQSGETAGDRVRRARNLLFSMQSGGEHFMQNSVLFAVLKSSRLFTDVDGTFRVGNFQNYIWKTEYDTLLSIIKNKPELLNAFTTFKMIIKNNKKEMYKYDTFKKNIVEEFLRYIKNKELTNEYINKRKEAINKAKEEWNKLPSAIDQLELKDGRIKIKENSQMTKQMIYQLKNTVVGLNDKIHGYYNRIAAAKIEFQWWGGLVMQYHKHIYPGIMKRFRTKGYYNEGTNTIEIGSYASVYKLLTTDFNDISKRIKNRQEQGELAAVASIKEVTRSLIDCILNIKLNWQLMPQYEKNACKRTLGDIYGIISAMLLGIAIYALTDDDDEKENEFVATALYMSDRLLNEAQMYTPWGLATEAKTMWSSPLAATNSVTDALKAISFMTQWIFDDDYNPNYKTGLYAGQNKLGVIVKRNIPAWRIYNRMANMTRNNSYYRLNESNITMKTNKAIADMINPD